MKFMVNRLFVFLLLPFCSFAQLNGNFKSVRFVNVNSESSVKPINGTIYYNQTTGKFRAYENGVWKDLISGGGSPAGVDGDIQINSSGSFGVVNTFRYESGRLKTNRNFDFTQAGGNEITFTDYFAIKNATGTKNLFWANNHPFGEIAGFRLNNSNYISLCDGCNIYPSSGGVIKNVVNDAEMYFYKNTSDQFVTQVYGKDLILKAGEDLTNVFSAKNIFIEGGSRSYDGQTVGFVNLKGTQIINRVFNNNSFYIRTYGNVGENTLVNVAYSSGNPYLELAGGATVTLRALSTGGTGVVSGTNLLIHGGDILSGTSGKAGDVIIRSGTSSISGISNGKLVLLNNTSGSTSQFKIYTDSISTVLALGIDTLRFSLMNGSDTDFSAPYFRFQQKGIVTNYSLSLGDGSGFGKSTQIKNVGDLMFRVVDSSGNPSDLAFSAKKVEFPENSGTAVLSSGSVTVSYPNITAQSIILLTIQSPSGTVGSVYVHSRTIGSGFEIRSTSTLDNSTVGYLVIN